MGSRLGESPVGAEVVSDRRARFILLLRGVGRKKAEPWGLLYGAGLGRLCICGIMARGWVGSVFMEFVARGWVSRVFGMEQKGETMRLSFRKGCCHPVGVTSRRRSRTDFPAYHRCGNRSRA